MGELLHRLRDEISEALASAERPTATEDPEHAVGSQNSTSSRRGKVNITGYYDPSVKSSLRWIQAQNPARTVQDLLAEALNDLFAKYGVPESAKLAKGSPK